MTHQCIDTPVSWLRLERYQLGELAPVEREAIKAHVRACPACAACLEEVDNGAKKALPPLPTMPPKPAKISYLAKVVPIVTTLALAAVLLLFVGPFSKTSHDGALEMVGTTRTKGGDVAFTLVRDDDELIGDASGTYHDGDRFKALVTCPAGLDASWDLVVFERGAASFPLASATRLACGNAVPLEGAFRLTGAEVVVVCVVWGETTDRAKIVSDGEHALGDNELCKLLEPASK